MILVRQAGAPRVDVALHQLHVFQRVRDHGAAFSGRDQLARLKTESSQIPHGTRACPFHIAPCACAQSSITFKLCFLAMRKMSSMSANRIPRCTGRIAFVFGVMACSINFVSRQYVSGSTSTKTGTAFSSNTGPTVPSQV